MFAVFMAVWGEFVSRYRFNIPIFLALPPTFFPLTVLALLFWRLCAAVTVFLEFWKRYQSQLEFEWDTVEFLEQQEPSRPEYDAKCVHERKNSVTGVKKKKKKHLD